MMPPAKYSAARLLLLGVGSHAAGFCFAAATAASIATETLAAASALGNGFGLPSGQRSAAAFNVVKLDGSEALSRTTLPATETLKAPLHPGTSFTLTESPNSSPSVSA